MRGLPLRFNPARNRYRIPAALMALVMLLLALPTAAEQRFINIGTGGVTGVYYPAGQHLCRLFNTRRDVHGMRCTAESTGGSVFNLNMVRSGDMDFGVAQSDLQYHAYHGTGRFEAFGPAKHLRAMFSLHPEPLTLVVRPDSEISSIDDLPGKRVNIGNPGSGQRTLMERLITELGWDHETFQRVGELPSREQAQALCDNRIDAFVFSVGHPSAAIQEPIATCDARLVSIAGPAIEELVAATPYYLSAVIPAETYPGQDRDIHTYGVGATLVTSSRVPETAAFELTRAVFDNFDTFRELHPAFRGLEREGMVDEGLSAPMHPGARRYFREAGLIDD